MVSHPDAKYISNGFKQEQKYSEFQYNLQAGNTVLHEWDIIYVAKTIWNLFSRNKAIPELQKKGQTNLIICCDSYLLIFNVCVFLCQTLK